MKTNYIKQSMLTVVIFTLTACSVSKNIEIPTNAFPESYRNTMSTTDTTTVATIQWKDYFAEHDLRTLLDSAISRNNDLQLAQKNISIARLRFASAKWGNIPQANLQMGASSTRLSDNSINAVNLNQALGQRHVEDYSASIGLSWEADIWGKIRNQTKNALVNYQQSEEVKKSLQTTLVADVAKGYYNLLMLDAQLEIAKKNLKLNDNSLLIVKLQYDSGQVNALAVEQSEAQRLVAAQLVPQIEQQITIQENAISILTGTFPEAQKRTAGLDRVLTNETLSTGVPSYLLNLRPDVKLAELQLTSANARVGITKASLYPSLIVTAAGGVNAFEVSNWFTIPASLFGTVAGGLTQPILNGKKLKTAYEVAKVEREKVVIQFRQTVLVAVAEVSNAQAKVVKTNSRELILKQRVEKLNAAVVKADMLFKSGLATYLEVIIAQGNLLQSELDLATVKREQQAAKIELYRALGGGWK